MKPSRTTTRWLFLTSLALSAPNARADEAPNDVEALALAREAIEADYLATDFAKAEEKLLKAVALCPGKACSARVRARLHRDLGVVRAAGLRRPDDGRAQFVEALQSDSSVALDADLTTPELEALFKSAAESLGIEPAPPARPEEPPAAATPAAVDPPKPEPTPAKVETKADAFHSPPPEQMIGTPIPLYVEGKSAVPFSKVKVRYRPLGDATWKSLEMSKMKSGWGIEIPCLDVGSTGAFSYFIQAYDASGDLVVEDGSMKTPNTVSIVSELEGEPPHFPGRPPPAQCREASDCPPDFPGCFGGDPGTKTTRKESKRGDFENWVGATLQQDVMLLGRTHEVCAEGSDYTCFSENGDFYDVIPREGSGGEVGGGVNIATTRFLLAYDRIIADEITLGVRIGYALGGGPKAPGGKAFVPVHAELRGSYFFGASPFQRRTVRPFAVASGGIAQVDSEVDVTVFDNEQRFDANQPTKLEAWRKAGTAFAAIGGGAMYPLASEHAIAGELRLMQMFGEPATVLAVDVGYTFGL